MKWLGSKGGNGVWQRILSEMPEHRLYVEPFCGAAVIARKKRPSVETWLLDADPSAPGLAMVQTETLLIADFGDAVAKLREWRGQMRGDTLVYCDPPYLRSVRGTRRYRVEFDTEEQHTELLNVLRSLHCHVMLSGYRSELYDAFLANWRRVDIPTVNRAGRRVTECLWMNYPEHYPRHDLRFVGSNFRDRERIRRMARRWAARLAKLTTDERAAVLAALDEAAP